MHYRRLTECMIPRYDDYLQEPKCLTFSEIRQEKQNQDPGRTSCHDSLITKFNMLYKYLKMQGKEATWRDTLGDEDVDPYNRKRIGDFGCYIAFINGLSAR